MHGSYNWTPRANNNEETLAAVLDHELVANFAKEFMELYNGIYFYTKINLNLCKRLYKMNYKEFGKQNSDVIILLHGGGLSWWNYRKEAEMLQNDFHVILPVLDGHAESDRDFTTIEDNAKEIISFIDETFDGYVLLIGGLSLGGQILLEIMSRRADICEYAIVESALVVPSKMIYSMIKPVFGNCYGLIKHKWFSKLQFKSLKMNQEFFDDYYRDTCKITKQNMIAFLQANSMYSIKDLLSNSNAKVSIFVGGQENSSMKSSAKTISKIIEGSSLRIKEGMYHGEFSINHPGDYVKEIYAITR